MAVTATKIKVSYDEAMFKVQGSNGNVILNLATDMTATNEKVQGTPVVAISNIIWTGDTDSVIQITRNNVVIFTLQANAAGMLDFIGQFFPPDVIEGSSNIKISINANQGELFIRLRKLAGFVNTDQLTLIST